MPTVLPISSTNTAVAQQKKAEIAINPFSPTQIANLASELGACILVQKTYGKQGGDDIKALTKIFMSDLKEFQPEEIVQAIIKCRQTQDDFVTVAAVRRILSPEPKFDYAIYKALTKEAQAGRYLNPTELRYIKAYEENAMKGI